jgi:hypothetical protein
MRSNDVSIALRRVLRPSGYELGGPGVCKPSLLLAPGVGRSAIRQKNIYGSTPSAVEHGGVHVIKFADTAVEVFARTGHPDAIAAVLRALELIDP